MTISRPLWASQRGGVGGGTSGEVVVTGDQHIPTITATLGYVGADDDPVVTLEITDPAADAQDLRVYRSTSPLDAAALPAPLATLTPATASDDDAAVTGGATYYYRLASVTGSLMRLSAEVSVAVVEKPAGPDFSTAQIGDEIGGGIYAGVDTIDGTDYHIVAGDAASEAYGLEWKTSATTTAGTGSDTDGLANTNAMVAAGVAEHPAAEHCVSYTGGGHSDWHVPARSQLTLMYSNLAGHAEFADNVSSGDQTWTSTEATQSNAWARRLSNGDLGGTRKDERDVWARPVRRVAV
ncbi:DUF1566 domain-containing protein [Halomonas borealis]|uniref:DUF1566 domain-containing protein n=1 Tax=Halomonas borealis TaxID=2508710 RepID=UPI0010A0937A|nr:DUF1566 domain-containing protein [Halomonas borealis]